MCCLKTTSASIRVRVTRSSIEKTKQNKTNKQTNRIMIEIPSGFICLPYIQFVIFLKIEVAIWLWRKIQVLKMHLTLFLFKYIFIFIFSSFKEYERREKSYIIFLFIWWVNSTFNDSEYCSLIIYFRLKWWD